MDTVISLILKTISQCIGYVISCLGMCLTFLWKYIRYKHAPLYGAKSESLGMTSWENEVESSKAKRCIINVGCVENSLVSKMQIGLKMQLHSWYILCCFLGCFQCEHFDIYFGDITPIFISLLEFGGTAYFVGRILSYIHWILVVKVSTDLAQYTILIQRFYFWLVVIPMS